MENQGAKTLNSEGFIMVEFEINRSKIHKDRPYQLCIGGKQKDTHLAINIDPDDKADPIFIEVYCSLHDLDCLYIVLRDVIIGYEREPKP